MTGRPADTVLALLQNEYVRRIGLDRRRVLGREPLPEETPVILDTYANTSSAGSIIAFHQFRDDLARGERGVICSFGAGYSVGSLVVERCD